MQAVAKTLPVLSGDANLLSTATRNSVPVNLPIFIRLATLVAASIPSALSSYHSILAPEKDLKVGDVLRHLTGHVVNSNGCENRQVRVLVLA